MRVLNLKNLKNCRYVGTTLYGNYGLKAIIFTNSSPSENNFSSTQEKGTSFEEECKNILIEKGWKVDTTPSSNDQGADLIATRGLLKLIAQCKN